MTPENSQLALMIDLERCIGCKSCEAACKQANGLGPNTYRNRVMWFDEQQSIENDDLLHQLTFLTVTCQQCERPACLRACPVNPKVISKDPQTGVVSIDTERCTGCGECALACPYGAIGYNAENHHAVKCDLCASRREQGKGSACAEVCPAKAISFGTRSDLLDKAADESRQIIDTDYFLQQPATLYLEPLKERSPLRSTPALMSDHQPRQSIDTADVSAVYRTPTESPTDVKQPERVVAGGCNICFNGCPLKFTLRGNEVMAVYGNDEDPQFQGRICPKSQMTLQMYNSPHRLKQPLKRIGPRGSDQFEEISWQQALDEIAVRLSQVREQHGSEALAIQSGSRTGVLNIIGAIPTFAALWGTPNTATTEPYCDLGKGVALNLTQGTGMMVNTYTEDDIGQAGAYVYIGDNQAETRPVNFGLVNDWRVRNGTAMIVVDPRHTATASKADTWLAIRSGTDLALGLAIIHHLFSENLHDLDFCERWIVGWQEWRDFIFERNYSPAWATTVTDLEVSAIEDLARTIGEADGCMIFLSRGINQHTNSAQTNRVYMFIAAITGNWGRRGGGYFNVSSEMNWGAPIIPQDRKPSTRPAINRNPSAWVDAMLKDEPYPLRALISSNNPLGQWPNQNRVRQAIQQLDLFVHLELFKNATSRYADYVLPMASGIEKGGTTRFAEDRRIIWNDRFIDPPGEARSDHWFWIELGKRFAFDDVLKDDYKQPRKLWDELMVPATPDLADATTEKLTALPTRNIRLPFYDGAAEDDPSYVTEYCRRHPDADLKYPTPSGKLEFYTEALEERFRGVGLSALPEFYSEAEQLIDLPHLAFNDEVTLSGFFTSDTLVKGAHITDKPVDRDQRFDTELITGRPPAPHFHSWTHYFWQAQEMWPELYCQIHPNKASKLGIRDGDELIIETANGQIEARAWVRQGIRETAVFVPLGWDEMQPYHPASSVNHLTGIKLDPVSQQANLKSHLCQVRRVP